MPRNLPAGVTAVLGDRVQYLALLFRLETETGPVLLTTAPVDVSFESETYLSVGDLVAVSDMSEGPDLQQEAVTVTLSGVPGVYAANALAERLTGKKGIIRMMWFTDASFTTAAGGVTIFEGLVDRQRLDDAGQLTVAVTLSSVLARMREPTNRVATPNDQKTYVDADDRIFDNVAGLQDAEVGNWGRPPR